MLGNIFILGDSYSTFTGYIPDGYCAYYTPQGPDYIAKNPDLKLEKEQVCRVEQTWWYNLSKDYGTLIRNCSWSGTTICNTGYNGIDRSEMSFVARMKKLIKEGYFNENRIDTFFLFGGTNDSWANSPLGDRLTSDWNDADLYNVLPAFSYLINLLILELPETRLYCILNDELKSEIKEFYKITCERNGVDIIELCNIDKINGHPTIKGMSEIREQVFDYLKSKQRI